jgi:hypothetical protein
MNIQQYGSTDLTLQTAHFGISLLNCTKIQNLLYSNCSKRPPPAAKQFSARMSRDLIAEATLSGCLRMCSAAAKIRSCSAALDLT